MKNGLRSGGPHTAKLSRRPGQALSRQQLLRLLVPALRGADEFMKSLCDNLGIQVGETTPDGFLTLEAVTCLAACDKAPMFQTQGPDGIKYHENMTVDRTVELLEVLRRKS